MKSIYRSSMAGMVLFVVFATILFLPGRSRCQSLKDVYIPPPLVEFLNQAGRPGHLWVPLNIPGNYCGPGAILEIIGFPGPNPGITPLGNVTKCYPEAVRTNLFKLITSSTPAIQYVQNRNFSLNPELTLKIFGFSIEAGGKYSRVRNVDLQIKDASIESFDLVELNSWGKKPENRGKLDLNCCDYLTRPNIYVIHEAFTIKKATYTFKDGDEHALNLKSPDLIKDFITIGADIKHSITTDGKLEINQPVVIAVRRVARVGCRYGEYVPMKDEKGKEEITADKEIKEIFAKEAPGWQQEPRP